MKQLIRLLLAMRDKEKFSGFIKSYMEIRRTLCEEMSLRYNKIKNVNRVNKHFFKYIWPIMTRE